MSAGPCPPVGTDPQVPQSGRPAVCFFTRASNPILGVGMYSHSFHPDKVCQLLLCTRIPLHTNQFIYPFFCCLSPLPPMVEPGTLLEAVNQFIRTRHVIFFCAIGFFCPRAINQNIRKLCTTSFCLPANTATDGGTGPTTGGPSTDLSGQVLPSSSGAADFTTLGHAAPNIGVSGVQ